MTFAGDRHALVAFAAAFILRLRILDVDLTAQNGNSMRLKMRAILRGLVR